MFFFSKSNEIFLFACCLVNYFTDFVILTKLYIGVASLIHIHTYKLKRRKLVRLVHTKSNK